MNGYDDEKKDFVFGSKEDEDLWSAIGLVYKLTPPVRNCSCYDCKYVRLVPQHVSHQNNENAINIREMRTAIRAGANVNSRNQENQLPIHKLVSSNRIGRRCQGKRYVYNLQHVMPLVKNAIEVLAGAGADVNAYDGEGQLPLNLAIRNEFSAEVIQTLLRAKANPNLRDNKGINVTTRYGRWNAINLVWDSRVLITNRRRQRWKHHVTRLLLNSRANINSLNPNGYAPIHMVIFARRHVTYDVNNELLFLISVGANVDLCYAGTSPLAMAAQKMDTEKIEILIQAGCNLNMQNVDGNTSLHLAAKVASRTVGTATRRRYHQNMRLFRALTAENPVLIAKQRDMLKALTELRLFGRSVSLPLVELIIVQYAFATSINTQLRNLRGQTAYDIGKNFLSDDALELLGMPKLTLISREV
jgi:ankyrin repeat protein